MFDDDLLTFSDEDDESEYSSSEDGGNTGDEDDDGFYGEFPICKVPRYDFPIIGVAFKEIKRMYDVHQEGRNRPFYQGLLSNLER